MNFTTKLLKKETVAAETAAFFWEKPAGFVHLPGQYCTWKLIDPPETDAEGNSRDFSLASTPTEDFLLIASRMRDTAFKRVLGQMSPGDKISVAGPMGHFTLPADLTKTVVPIAGGIGITPIRSMILSETEKKSLRKILLFYSNRRPEDAAFLQELQQAKKNNPNFKLIATMTKPEISQEPWPGETGHITTTLLKKYLSDLFSVHYFLVGPPDMVFGLNNILLEAGISPDNIRAEDFAGY